MMVEPTEEQRQLAQQARAYGQQMQALTGAEAEQARKVNINSFIFQYCYYTIIIIIIIIIESVDSISRDEQGFPLNAIRYKRVNISR